MGQARSILLFIFIIPVVLLAQPAPKTRPDTISTQSWQLASASGLTYQITVTCSGPAPAAGYPVLYILDGNAYGPLLAAEAKLEAGHQLDQSYLLVAVGYPTDQLFDMRRRQYDDTTPWRDITTAAHEHIVPADTGGADVFGRFITNDLRNEINKNYPVDTARQSIFGHSLGGLFVLHLLMTQPNSFTHYSAASPSAWWNHSEIIAQAQNFMHNHPSAASLQISVGEYEQKLSPQEAIRPDAAERKARLEERGMINSARKLANILQASLLIVPNADHIGSVAEAGRLTLHMAFNNH